MRPHATILLLALCAGWASADIDFTDFSNTSSLKLNGDASVAGLALRLTPSTSYSSGSAFSLTKIALKDNGSARNVSFSTSFAFQMSNVSNSGDGDGGGADGLTFVVQPNANNVGSAGGGMGYSGIGHSVGVEFDTYNNGTWDSNNGNHIGIDLDGNLTSVAQSAIATRMNNGATWYAWVDYDGSTEILEARLAQTNTRPAAATLSYSVDLRSVLGQDSAFVGFTAATGASSENHDVISWHFAGKYHPYGAPRVYVNDTTAIEADTAVFTIRLDSASAIATTVRWRTVDGTAEAGSDYDSASGIATIPAGSVSTTVKVRTRPDTSSREGTESFTVHLSKLVNASVGDTVGTGYIVDTTTRPPSVRVALDTQEVAEGDSLRVRFQLTATSGKNVTAWFRASGTASSGMDDDLVAGRHYKLSFPAGTDTASVLMHAYKDNLYEPTETVLFTLDSAVNASVLAAHFVDTVSILDVDGLPTVSFGTLDTTVSEGVGTLRLTLKLSHPASISESVGIRGVQGTAALDSLVRGSDAILDTTTLYRATFAAGDTVATFAVRIIDDGRVEPTEWFSLKFARIGHLTLGASSTIRIRDDDALPVVAITSPKDSLFTNRPDHEIDWTLGGVAQSSKDTVIAAGWNAISRCYTDTAGNTGCDTIHVWGDFTPPAVAITKLNGRTLARIDTGIHLVNTIEDTVYWTVADDSDTTRHVLDTSLSEGLHTIVRVACDKAGNCGSDTIEILVDTTPPTVTINAPSAGGTLKSRKTVVEWTWKDDPAGTRYDISGSERDSIVLSHYGSNAITRCATDSAGNKACASVNVELATPTVTSAYYLDSDGDGRVDEAVVVFDSSLIDGVNTSLAFRFALNGELRTKNMSQVSRNTVVVKLDSAFRYGRTSTDDKDTGVFAITTAGEGTPAASTMGKSFPMVDSIAPVILSATVVRTESYSGKDSLHIATSEAIDLSGAKGWLQVRRCKDGQAACDSTKMSWETVPADSVHHDGMGGYYILIDTAATGTVRPTLQIRFVDGTADAHGNASDTSRTTWKTLVGGDARPSFFVVSVPTVTVIPASEANVVLPGAIAIKAGKGSNGSSWWSGSSGYTATNPACKDESWCAGPTIRVNHPVQIDIYIYDQAGSFVFFSTIDVTKSDLESLRTDKLDRISLKLDWNYRTGSGHLVGSGVYVWRILSIAKVDGLSKPVVTNSLYKLGLKVK